MLKIRHNHNNDPLYSIETTAKDEEDFTRDLSEVLSAMIEKCAGKEGALKFIKELGGSEFRVECESHLECLLPIAFELLCKMRGYKAPGVVENRLLLCGDLVYDGNSDVYASDQERPIEIINRERKEAAKEER